MTLLQKCYADVAAVSLCCHMQKADAGVASETALADDTFLKEELGLSALLLAGWTKAVEDTKIVDSLTIAANSGNQARLTAEMEGAQYKVDTAFEDYVDQDAVRKTIERTVEIGLLLYASAAAFDALSRNRKMIVDAVFNSVRYFTNSYFMRIVQPALLNAVLIAGTSLSLTDFTASVLKELEKTVTKAAPYWRTVANVEISRGHHYGILRGAQSAGFRAYRFSAVRDDRTTAICRSMDGREFWIADGINVLEDIIGMDPAAIVSARPWPTSPDSFSDLSAREIMSAGWSVPPLHFNCRSTIVPIV